MAAVAIKNLPGFGGSVEVDGEMWRVRGWKAKRSVAEYDDSATGGAGWSSAAAALKSMEVSFTMDVPATTTPDDVLGLVFPCTFRIKPTYGYTGNFLFTDASPNVDIKGGVTLDVTAKNVDAVTMGTVAAPT